MAKQVEGVYEKLFEVAKKEFLEKGFRDASLRTIAQEADTSTSSIYTRFGDKEGLFSAIVKPVVDHMVEMFRHYNEEFHSFDADVQKSDKGEYTDNRMDEIIDYIYENFDEFSLLLDASYGTKFQSFVDVLTDIEVEYTYKYMKVVGIPSIESGEIGEDFLHMVTGSYFNGIFEVVRHRMDREKAGRYISLLSQYNRAGFNTLFKKLS